MLQDIKVHYRRLKYIEDITRGREDMNFIFEWQNNIYERAQGVSKILFFCHEKIKFISSSRRVKFFLLYRHADDGVFDDFPKISDHLPKIQNCSEGRANAPEHFPRMSENVRRFPKIAEDFRGRPEDVSMIHQRI